MISASSTTDASLTQSNINAASRSFRETASIWATDKAHPASLHRVRAERFRAEGKVMLLRCVYAESRTPAVAVLSGARVAGGAPLEVLERVQQALPRGWPW